MDGAAGQSTTNDACLLVFARYPTKGTVKKRLAADIGESLTVELYRSFVLDLLSTIEQLAVPLRICFHPHNSGEAFAAWLGTKYRFVPQEGRDLGERMKNGFIRAFAEGYRRVGIVGSDVPDLPAGFITEAFLGLETHDAVIGPSFDGGYYLMGFRQTAFVPAAFEGIPWGTGSVIRETRSILEKEERSIHLLPAWNDIDTLDDLKDLFTRNRATDFSRSRTIACLARIVSQNQAISIRRED